VASRRLGIASLRLGWVCGGIIIRGRASGGVGGTLPRAWGGCGGPKKSPPTAWGGGGGGGHWGPGRGQHWPGPSNRPQTQRAHIRACVRAYVRAYVGSTALLLLHAAQTWSLRFDRRGRVTKRKGLRARCCVTGPSSHAQNCKRTSCTARTPRSQLPSPVCFTFLCAGLAAPAMGRSPTQTVAPYTCTADMG
jgi:hypothetical protein